MPDKILYASVIALFNIIGKITSWKFTAFPVVCYTLAAYTFSAAGLITAIAHVFIFLYLAFHFTRLFLT
jgi:hypothetical protein